MNALKRNLQSIKTKLSPKEKRALKEKLKIFKEDTFDSRLKTHRLSGGFKDYYSFRISYKDRIRFKIVDEGIIFFYDIGNHNSVY
ncbi:hypothetical protein CSB09_01740 [Candidatus Gracilibacteria bacterium]|nr:MAG: hypothetical protein CSB09_01740 [Candidatus Gracilibacteria bacterium]